MTAWRVADWFTAALRFLALLLVWLPTMAPALVAAPAETAIADVQASARTVPLYGKFELTFAASGTWTNPFDPAQVKIDCVIAPPQGDEYAVPAFYFQDYRLERKDPEATWDYFGQFRFPLARGDHRVVVANTQPATPDNYWRDRVTVAFELTNFRRREGLNLDWAGLQSDDCLLIWLHDPAFPWMFARLGRKVATQPWGVLHLRHVADGNYTVEWRDTWTDEIIARGTAQGRGGGMAVDTPAIARSAVAKLIRFSP